tara:strand:+ start:1342 stop:2118 length:777 start_codon:yes stop_codon:yes gene_type:complete
MPSPSKPSDFSNLVLTSSSTLCDRFKAVLLTLPSKLYDFFNYALDANGNPSKTFAKDLLANTGVWSIGDLKATLSNTTPDGWIDCEGQSISRTTYSDLYAVISNQYGSGDGSTTFNLPDLRKIALVGRNDSSNQMSDYSSLALGDITGSEDHSLTSANYPETSFNIIGYATAHGDHSSATTPSTSADKEKFREALGTCLYHENSGHTHQQVSHDPDGSSMIASTYNEVTIPGAEGEAIPLMQPSIGVRFLMYTGYYPA